MGLDFLESNAEGMPFLYTFHDPIANPRGFVF